MATLNYSEARRYLGVKVSSPELDAQLRDAGNLLMKAAVPKGVWKRFPLERRGHLLCFAGLEVDSADLSSHLEGCDEVFLLAATLGIEVDRLITRLSVTDIGKAVMVQACAAALLETQCDEYQQQMDMDGLFPRPRFSPGYGDFSAEHQAALLAALEAGKRIGLTATSSCMLAPTKSVTAVIGLGRDNANCTVQGCAACGKTDCIFRREV